MQELESVSAERRLVCEDLVQDECTCLQELTLSTVDLLANRSRLARPGLGLCNTWDLAIQWVSNKIHSSADGAEAEEGGRGRARGQGREAPERPRARAGLSLTIIFDHYL